MENKNEITTMYRFKKSAIVAAILIAIGAACGFC